MRIFHLAATALGIATILAGMAERLRAQPQPGEYLFVLENGLSLVTNPDGIKLLRATNAPVVVQPGSIPGRATLTSVVDHPTAPFFVSILTLDAAGQRVSVADVRSRPGAAVPFHRSAAYLIPAEVTGRQRFSVRWIDSGPSTPPFVGVGLTPQALAPQDVTFQHGFTFLDPRVDRIVDDTNTAVRNRSTWSLLQGGAATQVGLNFTYAFANPAQSATVNFFRLPDEQSGAIVWCEGTTRPCFVVGTGSFDAFSGFADSLSIPSFGDFQAASYTTINAVLNVVPSGYGACAQGQPPAPAGLISARRPSAFAEIDLSWDSVACARAYRVRLFAEDGSQLGLPITISNTEFSVLQVNGPNPQVNATSFTVASLDANDVEGPQSARRPIAPPS
jgi:hypothetical protein